MTFLGFVVVLTGALTASAQFLRLVDWLDRPAQRRPRRAVVR